MWPLRLNPSSVCTWQNKAHNGNVLVPLCCRAAKRKGDNFQSLYTTVQSLSCPGNSCQCGSRSIVLGGQGCSDIYQLKCRDITERA